ncbi:hypothetical protein SSPSH_000992 [Salinisphaera shabanensis E1L3A]|jgi:hypothetical protein|uniref:Secreted protein n=1 Tax=Salinisphaera shabanensis E1L3A TaxID=1033802 RepID=U2ENY1_9GAMM|nr:hypothetical protein SSPSH_000992 [Salinisphaera shabanensis E1L3A]
MYYPKKTQAIISSFCLGAIALGGATIASAQVGSLDRYHNHGALNNADVQFVATENSVRRIQSPESWRTSTGKATASRLGGNINGPSTPGETEGVRGGEDYDVAPDRPEKRTSSADQSELDESRGDPGTKSNQGTSESVQDHSDPRSHIHAGPHNR